MFKCHAVVLTFALGGIMGSGFAADGDKADKKLVEIKPATQPAPAQDQAQPAEFSSCDECHHSGPFTRFWTHTVGGSIGHGLKKGAAKISSGF